MVPLFSFTDGRKERVAFDKITAFFVHQGSSLGAAKEQAMAWIGQTIAGQGSLMSYADVYWAYTILAFVMIPVCMSLKRVRLRAMHLGE